MQDAGQAGRRAPCCQHSVLPNPPGGPGQLVGATHPWAAAAAPHKLPQARRCAPPLPAHTGTQKHHTRRSRHGQRVSATQPRHGMSSPATPAGTHTLKKQYAEQQQRRHTCSAAPSAAASGSAGKRSGSWNASASTRRHSLFWLPPPTTRSSLRQDGQQSRQASSRWLWLW